MTSSKFDFIIIISLWEDGIEDNETEYIQLKDTVKIVWIRVRKLKSLHELHFLLLRSPLSNDYFEIGTLLLSAR